MEKAFSVSKDDANETLHRRGDKACRVCDDFKSWRKKKTLQEPKQPSHSSLDIQNGGNISENCPLDTDQLGRHTWSFLHTMAAYYAEKPTESQKLGMLKFIDLFSQFYPCEHCALDFQKSVKAMRANVEDRYSLSHWFCQQHNIVNRKLGKPEFDCSKVLERWRYGWKDGSCD